MQVSGFVSDVREWENKSSGKTYKNRIIEIEGFQVRARPQMKVPEVGREIKASVSVSWHKSSANGNGGKGRAFATYELQGWAYIGSAVQAVPEYA